jgi:hypothetical protein
MSYENIEKFSTIENDFFEEHPELKKKDNNFMCNGRKINKKKSLKDNNIKNKDIIILMSKD